MKLFRNLKKSKPLSMDIIAYDDHVEMAVSASNEVTDAMFEIVREALDMLKEKEEEKKDFEMYGKYASPEETE